MGRRGGARLATAAACTSLHGPTPLSGASQGHRQCKCKHVCASSRSWSAHSALLSLARRAVMSPLQHANADAPRSPEGMNASRSSNQGPRRAVSPRTPPTHAARPGDRATPACHPTCQAWSDLGLNPPGVRPKTHLYITRVIGVHQRNLPLQRDCVASRRKSRRWLACAG